MKIGLNLYTLREFVRDVSGIEETFHKLQKIGYKYVQISGIGSIDVKLLKKILDDCGLSVCITHVPYGRLKDQTEQIIEEHRILQCNNIAIGGIPSELHNYEGYKKFADEVIPAARKIKNAGMTFSYHNHAIELVKYNGRTGLEIIFEQTPEDLVFAEPDTYWIQFGGGDPSEWLRRLKNRIVAVHFKDMGIIDNKPTMFEVGEGNLNWQEIIEACKYAGVEYAVVEQDECYRDPFESVEISFKNMLKMGLSQK